MQACARGVGVVLVLAAAGTAWGQASAPVPPTLAIFPLEAATGVDPGTARVLTDFLVDEVRRTRVFSRVVSAQEIEALIGFERQRQLLDCADRSCLAEIAGTLGVDMVLGGSLAKLGGTFLCNLRVTETATALTRSSVTLRVKGESAEALLDAVRPSVLQLLAEAGLTGGLVASPGPPAAPAPPPRAAAPAHPSTQATSGEGPGGPSLRLPLWGAGALGLLAGAGGGVVGAGVAGAALLTQGLWRLGVFTPAIQGVLYEDRLRLFYGTSALGMGVAGLGLLVSIVLVVAGLGSVVAGVVLG